MKENVSNEKPALGRVGEEEKHFIKSADTFLHKPDGIFLICLLFFGLTVWTFAPVLQTNFQVFDDDAIFLNNSHVNTGLSWQNLSWALFSTDYSYSYPLTRISHMLDFEMFGPHPWGHHLTNVLLHAANGVLLFLVLKRMTAAFWRSLIVAMLFALHPLRVESVAWISERKDVLSAFFGLLALWTYARFTEESKMEGGRSKRFYGLTLLFFTFGLMSKSMLVTFPCLLLLLDFWPLERWRWKSKWNLIMEKAPFFLLVVPVSIATYFATRAGGQFILHSPLSSRLENVVTSYARYLGKMFWPTNFSVLYPYQDFWPVNQLLCAAALILGISVAAFTLRQRRPYLLVGWLWYLGMLVPVIGLIPLGGQSICNRFTYIPMIGILLFLVWAADDLSRQWRLRTILVAVVVALVLGVCIFRTRAEIVYWKNGETLWSRAVAVTKNNFMAHYCLALVLASTKPNEQIVELQKSVDIYPDYYDAQLLLGKSFLANGHFSEAVAPFEKAMQLNPQSSWAYHDLSTTFYKLNRASDAIPPLMKAIEIDPRQTNYMDDLGLIFGSNSPGPSAISNFLATAQSDPAGFGHFIEAVQFDTNYVVLINNIAWYFATNPDPKLRNGRYAVSLATRTCEMTGYKSHSKVLALAAAYAEDSRFEDAISTAQLACSLASTVGQPELLRGDQALLELFRSRQPYHESYKATSP